jgi:alpha-2-macroglobulin
MKYNIFHCRVIRAIIVLSILLTAIQCKKNRNDFTGNISAFTEQISAFTSGIISSGSNIQVILAKEYPGQIARNTPVSEKIFRFKPSISGQAVWLDNRTIEFRPDQKLISGKKYEARFYLSKLMKVPQELAVLKFGFMIVEQAFNVEFEGYQTHNENDLVWNKMKGTVITADIIDNEVLAGYFTAIQGSRKLKIHWDNSSDQRAFHFTIDSIKRTGHPERADMIWNATSISKKLKGMNSYDIPALGDFKVMGVKVIQQPEQYVEIMFSDPLKKKQNFDGLVFISKSTSFNFSVDGNVLKAYPVLHQNEKDNITIQQEIINVLGNPLSKTYVEAVAFELSKPEVRFTGKGVILPSSKGLVLPFEAINLSAVEVKIIKIFENNIGYFLQVNRLDGSEQLKRAGRLIHKQTVLLSHEPVDLGKWNRFYIDLGKLIQPDPGSIYRVEISFRKSFSLYRCEEPIADKPDIAESEPDNYDFDGETSYWDSYEEYNDDYYDFGYDYNWNEREDPCSQSYYNQSRWVARNILASDLGIIAKSGDGNSLFCAVTNLVTTEPVSDVKVTLYNFQQQPISTGTTDKEGFTNLVFTDKPFLLIASHEKQRGYLRLDDGSSLSLGAFDVSGDVVQKGLKGFIYGERGVWRPGDTLFLTFMLEDKQKLLPAMHPVIFELYNPQGQLYNRHVKTSGINGFYSLAIPTGQDVPTGNWSVKVKAGGTQFEKNLKIETIKPNRLKIKLTFNTDRLTSGGPNITGDLLVNWLHGATARNLKSSVGVILTEEQTSFSQFPGYQFTDPAKIFSSEEESMFEDYVDDNGRATIPVHIHADNTSPGMLRANFTVRVFEKSGDFSIDRFSMPYSPYTSYVGIKTPEGDKRGMLLTDTLHWVDVVTLDESGKSISRTGLEVTMYKLDWRNWWELEGNELANYIGNTYNEPLFNKDISTVNGKGHFSFRIDRPDWGRFYIRVHDPASGHSAGKIIYIDWPGWAGRPMRENPEAASMLTFNSDKEKYTVGESAELIIPTGGKGRILLSIESGSQILMKKWLKATEKETRVKIPVTKEMTPNVYAYVTLIQPHENSGNDMPMRLYGVIPIFVEDQKTRLSPVIKMPDVLEPLQKVIIQVSEKNRQVMTYTLALVEEGLLDLTRFKTPDPWSRFYARDALGVKTWDLYDMVVGAYGGKLGSILGIGGDNEIVPNESGEKANRFKPVVRFLGPFQLNRGGTNKHAITLPNYIGSVKAMVVAGQDGAYGFADKSIPVKKPMMILATLPRVMGPGESVKLPVTIFAMDKQVKSVQVQVKTNSYLIINGEQVKTIAFEETGDQVVNFDLSVAQKTGKGQIKVIATCGKLTSEYEVELDIRTPNPPVNTFIAGTADAGKSWDTDFKLPGMENTNSAMLEVSGIPPIDAGRRLRYLLQYPHGCIEQITSVAFAQLYLTDVLDLDAKTKAAIENHIKSGISKLSTFQLSGGGFSYWPGEQQISSWGSSYAGHFLLEAEKKGYVIPSGLKSAWIRSQKQLARQWAPVQSKDKFNQDDLEQAYRLYTLALAGDPETGAMNRLREIKTVSPQTKWRLAAAYAITGQTQVAEALINREDTEIQEYRGSYSSYGSRERDWAMMLETMILLNEKSRGAVMAKKISDVLSSDYWMSTQSTAYCLLSMAKFGKGITADKLEFSYKLGNGKMVQVTSVKPVVQVHLALPGTANSGHVTIHNLGKGLIFVRVIMEGTPEAGKEEDFSKQLRLEVSYRNSGGSALDISKVQQGTDFYATVSVFNAGDFDCRQLALTQIFPPGWEIGNSRLADLNLPEKPAFSYQDIRDDRVNTYFDLRKGEQKTFEVLINAAYLGKFYLPGTYCEAMYDNSVAALKKGRWVEVIKP